MTKSSQATDDGTEIRSDSKRMRSILAVVGVGTLVIGAWKLVAGNPVTAGSMFVFTTLCVANLRSETVRRWMDDHPIVVLIALIPVAVVGVVAAMP
ncbi:hypothetical protein C499_14020 [Halogeometricum borinquense DSM 11551]|uniref:Uncharacterized protein n=2 Tax=Halogeometricum borinquense TaxID=60847 RepID=E4NU04_HALBP|nr:hypothetical protein [Halogeometricum borinquense]ADQ68524.1 hypothetical protein Hbor_29860 [Halogeometricum borinquense DSM 11551]ELY25605.1 hypothetical protein C499_14020 [Halogeometricum borinquense DSM 11551]